MNPQAVDLNNTIEKSNSVVYELLSEKGKAIFFPKKGILSQAADAKGKDINATIGIALEDDGTPMRLSSIADNIDLEPKDIFPYAPSYGKPELRKKWKEMIFEKNPLLQGKKISLPVVTNALTHGLSITGYMFCDIGDKIILPDLFWGNYRLTFVNAYGAEIDTFETYKGASFNTDGLKEKLKSEGDKKIVLLNFPNNPSGYTPTNDEVKEIVNILKESAESGKKLVVLCDDAYFGLVYKEGIYKESIFSELADLHENLLAIKIDGPTKEDYVWGLRVGFLTYGIKNGNSDIYGPLESKAAGAIRGNISNDSHLSQSLLLKAYTQDSYWTEKKSKFEILKSRSQEIENILEDSKFDEVFETLPFNSGYFMCIKLKKRNAEDVRQILLKEFSTGTIALGDKLRIAFSAVPITKLKLLFENIYNVCKES